MVAPLPVLPRWWCGRQAAGWYEGSLQVAEPLARQVAHEVGSGVDDSAFHTGSSRFDGEWALGTHQMAVMGLAQFALAHPEQADEVLPAIEVAVDRLLSPEMRAFGTAAWREDGLAPDATGSHAYLGYLNIALGMARLVIPDPDWASTHDALTASLERRLADAPRALVETYPGEAYPPDVSAVAGSIGLHGTATGTPHPALAPWARAFEEHYLDDSGLLVQSALVGSGRAVDVPRASGTAIAAYFTSFSDPMLSTRLHGGVERGAISVLGFGAVREYPPGHLGLGDIDSGPVLLGLGVSATGFALAGARIHQDRRLFVSLARTAHLFGAPHDRAGRRDYVTGGPLGNAILLAMLTAGPGAAEGQP